MILGYSIPPILLIAGGLLAGLLMVITMLVGLRIIKFKGRRHGRVHKALGYTILVVITIHGFIALTFLQGWKILS
jgi:hypothetical protein